MRSTCRLFMATILLVAAAAYARAQDPSPAPPPSAPDVAAPVAELPQIPAAEQSAPAVVPAPTSEQSTPAVEPAAVAATVVPPATEHQVTTTTRRGAKKAATAKKPVEMPVEKPVIGVTDPATAAPGTTAMDAAEKVPPPNSVANSAPAESVAPPPPAAKAVVAETQPAEAQEQKKLGIGSWILFGVAFIAFAGIATKFLRRRPQTATALVDFTGPHPQVKPVLGTRR